jgi:hypothetical protein
MSNDFPILLSAGLYKDGLQEKGFTSIIIDGLASTPQPSGAYGKGLNLQFVAIYDRKDPKKGPVFQKAVQQNPTDVPDGLAPFLTEDYIMFWMTVAWVSSMPQGALYKMLQKNGGGSKLEYLETLATKMACGMNTNLVYMLATIPNSGMEGIEAKDIDLQSSGPSTRLLLQMIQTPNGLFEPVDFQ